MTINQSSIVPSTVLSCPLSPSDVRPSCVRAQHRSSAPRNSSINEIGLFSVYSFCNNSGPYDIVLGPFNNSKRQGFKILYDTKLLSWRLPKALRSCQGFLQKRSSFCNTAGEGRGEGEGNVSETTLILCCFGENFPFLCCFMERIETWSREGDASASPYEKGRGGGVPNGVYPFAPFLGMTTFLLLWMMITLIGELTTVHVSQPFVIKGRL